jgi:hypothetical protein
VDDVRLKFLFGTVPPAESYADEDGRMALLAADRDGTQAALRTIVANQILDDDPPEVWRAAARLLKTGLRRHDVMDQLVIALRPLIMAALAGEPFSVEHYSEENYIQALDRLPLPSQADLEADYVAIAREARVIPADELERRLADRIGLPLDDPLTRSLLDAVDRELLDLDDSPLIMLAPDLVVHMPALVDGCVLTHRLSVVEQAGAHLDLEPDLDAFRRLPQPRVGDVALVRDDERWWGPTGWLADLTAGSLLAVRATEDGEVTIDALSTEPAAPVGLVEALRGCYDAEIEEPGLPVDGEPLVAGLLSRDAATFAEPRPPLSELAEAAGVERRGGEFAHDPSIWMRGQEVERLSRMMDWLGPDARLGMDAFALLTEDARNPAALREALDLMDDPEVLTVVVDELVGPEEEPQQVRHLVELADRLLTVAGQSVRAAVAASFAALAAERDRRPLDAESHLRAAARLAPDWDFVVDRLAWYESDRGDAVAALALWDAIGTSPDVPEVAELRPFASAAPRDMGRNEPCWCGSGRKFKQCHRGRPERAPVPERIGWLVRKAVTYVDRRGGLTSTVAPYLLARYPDPDDPDLDDAAGPDPLVVDVALFEGGLLERFIADRGPLLPEDELLLVQAWLLTERTVYEVTAVDAGRGVSVRDLRTGDRLEVRDRSFSEHTAVGQLVCARAVPDGTALQFVGAPFPVDPGTERHIVALLDEGDGLGVLEWVADRAAGPQLVSADGDELMLCTAVVTVPDGAAEVLDELLEPTDTGWVWPAAGDGDIVRMIASVGLDGNRLVASTITERRMDDLLALLDDALSDIEVVSETRERPDLNAPPLDAPAPASVDPAAIEDVLQQMERRWCDEPVPALDGLRPRDAVEDPTRRDDVARLIASFPKIDPASGAFGLRPDRLRELLGLG